MTTITDQVATPIDTTVDDLQSREFVESHFSKEIKRVDEDGDLSLYCYINSDKDSPDYVKHCRGLVYDNDKLVVKTYSYSEEYVAGTDDETIWKRLEEFDPNECVVFDSYEGFLIRVFFLQNKWYISTHRKLDAYKSKWSSRMSYGEIFEHSINAEWEKNEAFQERIQNVEGMGDDTTVLERLLSSLDKTMCYTFLTMNTEENRIVCSPPATPTVYHVGTFPVGKTLPSEYSANLDMSIDIPYPSRVHHRAELIDYVKNINTRNQQGVIVFLPNGEQFKIFHKDYRYLYDIRGNEQSIKFRYLQLRMDTDKRNALVELYPSSQEVMDTYENTIYRIAKHLKNIYIQRYIHKDVSTLPPHEFRFVSLCHKWHRDDREKNRISLEKVIELLNDQPPTFLNKFIREFLQEDTLKKRIATLNKETAAVATST